MCGAALEAAVEGFAPDEKVVQWLISMGRADRRRKFAYLGERLEYLEHGAELISPNLARNAYRVARARTDVIHLNLDSAPEARQVIKQLTTVLRELELPPE
jgi:hypothetical protein